MMHMQIIKTVKPFLIQEGRPTKLVKKLNETQAGKELVHAMFKYYCSQVSPRIDTTGWVLNTRIDIELYRYENFFVDRLRKAGL